MSGTDDRNGMQAQWELLQELEARILGMPATAAEWRQARADFPLPVLGPEVEARFREWFLLERLSEALGSPPALAWAPAELAEDSAWSRLLDNFLGVFQAEARGDGRVLLVDLWSGRAIQGRAAMLPPPQPDAVVVGRFCLADEEVHGPLPGVRMLQAPGLLQAVEQDLALARAQDPRGHLSQLEIERLFLPFAEAPPAEALPAQAGAEALAVLTAELEELLSADPVWPLQRIHALLAEGGMGGALDHLAFHSELDLDQLRRLLPAYLAASQAQYPSVAEGAYGADATPDLAGSEVEAGPVEQALEAFDHARTKGKDLDQAFAELEGALHLGQGVSAEPEPGGDAAVPVGPDRAAGMAVWLEAYRWEAGLDALDPGLVQFLDHLRALEMEGVDASEIAPSHLYPFLLAATDADQAQLRLRAITPFLEWAMREQGAPLEDFLADLLAGQGERLHSLIRCNARLAAAGARGGNQARLAQSEPPEVTTEGEESAAVVGFEEGELQHLRPGDLLQGAWHEGLFHVCAVVPAEALAAATPGDRGLD